MEVKVITNIKKIMLILMVTVFILGSFNIQAYANAQKPNTKDPEKTDEIKDGETKTIKDAAETVGFIANVGKTLSNLFNKKDKEESNPTSPSKGAKNSQIQQTPGGKTPDKTYKIPGDSSSGNTPGKIDVSAELIAQGYAYQYVSGYGYAYTKMYDNGSGWSYYVKDRFGTLIGTATPGGSDRVPVIKKPPKPVITTDTTTTKGTPYVKNIKPIEYHWTVTNTSVGSATEKAKTTTNTYSRTFSEAGTYIITATPYCLYEEGRDDKTTTRTYSDGKLIKSTTTPKYVKVREYYALDEANKSTFTLIVTINDIDKPIKLPPPSQDEVEVYYELVE